MVPELIDCYENGEVSLLVYQLDEGEKRWWIQAGAAAIEFTGKTMLQLMEIMKDFLEEGEL